MEETNKDLFEKVVKIAQARGFVFNASSIYGGLRSSYDYGPLGVLLKNSIHPAVLSAHVFLLVLMGS